MREEKRYKVIIVGDSGVGKSTIVARATGRPDPLGSTMGAACCKKDCTVDGRMVPLIIWDTAGQDSLREALPLYTRGAHIAIVAFAQDCVESYNHVPVWLEYLDKHVGSIPIVIVQNKCDKPEEIDAEQVMTLAHDRGAEFARTAAVYDTGIAELFETVARLIIGGLEPAPTVEQVEVPSVVELAESREPRPSPCKC